MFDVRTKINILFATLLRINNYPATKVSDLVFQKGILTRAHIISLVFHRFPSHLHM